MIKINKHKNILVPIALTAVTLFLVFLKFFGGYIKNPSLLKDATDVWTKNQTWKTYTNKEYGFEIKYPKEFLISENNDKLSIYSQPYPCETENTSPTLPRVKIDASEIKIEFKKTSGNNYQDIWKNSFGFKLEETKNGVKQQNYDGVEYFDGQAGYYFYQGAEMIFGRKAILVEKDSTSAIQIDSWTPVLVYGCEENLNKYQSVADQILSTFKFLNQEGTITGTVIENNLGCEVDVECYLMVDTGSEEVKVIYHYGEWPRCENTKAARYGVSTEEGDEIEIFAGQTNEGLSICNKDKYYIKVLSRDCPEGQVLKGCKLGPCCCPIGADCD